MSNVTVRYESSLNFFLTQPFEIGIRHLKVAFCNGSQKNLTEMAKERIIYRPEESEGDKLNPLTKTQRFFHLVTGVLETAGYVTIIVPFIVAVVDRIFNKPFGFHKGGPAARTHTQEGGRPGTKKHDWRKNPFDANGKEDPFYQGASWIKS